MVRHCTLRQAWVVGLLVLTLLVGVLAGCGTAPTGQQPTPTIPPPTPTAEGTPTTTISKPTPSPTPSLTPTAVVPVDTLFDPQRLSYAPDFYVPEIEQVLVEYPGPLKDITFTIGDRTQSFAEVLVRTAVLYNINPQILLARLELHSQLLSTSNPTEEQFTYAMGKPEVTGLYRQLRQGAIDLRFALRDYALHAADGALPALVFADGTQQAVPVDISLSRYVLSRALAKTTSADALPAMLHNFVDTYTWLFDDPRQPPTDWHSPAEPFLALPMDHPFRVTAFFDHNAPFLQEDGDLLSYWGVLDGRIPYDGHPGWDYALTQGDRVLAAAAGRVVFAGNSNDGCDTPARAVIIDHNNGYRSLYWHLSTLNVERGQEVAQGAMLGYAGETGCSEGPHLHFQVQYLGRDVDPYGWCADGPDAWAENPAGQESRWLWRDLVNPCGDPPAEAIVVDDSSAQFRARGAWQQATPGYGGSALYLPTDRGMFDRLPWQVSHPITPSVAVWQPALPAQGEYRVLAYIPYALNGLSETEAARYRVHTADGPVDVVVNNRELVNGWADLGVFPFVAGESGWVSLSTLAGDAGNGVWVDAVMWVPLEG